MKTKKSIADEMAESIIEALVRGVVPWECPFKSWTGGNVPRSIDGRVYRGLNRFVLTLACNIHGWTMPVFSTYRAAKAAGGEVRKGEHGIRIMFWRPVGGDQQQGDQQQGDQQQGDQKGDQQQGGENSGYVRKYGDNNNQDGDGDQQARTPPKRGQNFIVGSYTVFNVAQIDGLPPPPPPPPAIEKSIEAANQIIEDWASRDMPEINVCETETPCYIPDTDEVRIMPQGLFRTPEWFYHALFHELAHSTGHASRLARKLTGGVDKESYAREELLADMCAAMLDQHCGIEITRDNTVAYCASWLKAIQGMPGRTLLTVAAQAQKAYDYILGGQVRRS